MKRLLIVIALALSFASSAFAQQKNMEFVAGTKIDEDLKALAACVGLTGVIFDRGANLPGLQLMTSVSTQDCSDLSRLLPTAQTILPPIYTPYLEDNTLHVRITLQASTARQESNSPTLDQLGSTVLHPADDYAAISEHVHRAMLGDAAYERSVADNLRTPSLFSGPYRTGGLVTPYPGGGLAVPQPSYDNYAYSGYSGFIADHAYIQQQIDRDTWGGLRFKKGNEKDVMENVEIWGCGQRIIQADEGNNFFDHIVLVPIGCRPLTFRYTDGKQKDWEVEIPELIVPQRLQESKNITLNKDFFDKARERTERLRYSMIEQPDGSLKRVIRTPSN